MRNHRITYEADNDAFPADAYTADAWGSGIAWRVLGWETAPIVVWTCADCDASGYERPEGGGRVTDHGDPECEHAAYATDDDTERTGRVVAIMVGDDRHFTFEPDELTPLAREAYCGSCGQVGCTHDGLDRSAGE